MSAIINRKQNPDLAPIDSDFQTRFELSLYKSSSNESFYPNNCDIINSTFSIQSVEIVREIEKLKGRDVILLDAIFDLQLCGKNGLEHQLEGSLRTFFNPNHG